MSSKNIYITKICEICGNEFSCKRYNDKTREKRFCSQLCVNNHLSTTKKLNICSCLLCHTEVGVNSITLHYNSKQCIENSNKNESIKCNFCNKTFKNLNTNPIIHIMSCESNKNSHKYIENFQLSSKLQIKMASIVKNSHKEGKYVGAFQKGMQTRTKNGTLKHTQQSLENCRKAALKSNHQRVCKRTHNYTDKNGRTFKFDSKWEDALADRLDYLDVIWDRPKPIQWIDKDGISHNYFPDFYLPDNDLYLDPKNSYAEEQQKEKLEIVSKQINLVILRSLQECENFVVGLPRVELGTQN